MATIDSQTLWDRVGGDRELLTELLECFRQDYPAQIQAAREALDQKDSQGIEQAAHSLKGTLANLAATVAHRLAAELEDLGRSGQLAQANSTLAELEQELIRVTDSLDALCQGVPVEDPHRRR